MHLGHYLGTCLHLKTETTRSASWPCLVTPCITFVSIGFTPAAERDAGPSIINDVRQAETPATVVSCRGFDCSAKAFDGDCSLIISVLRAHASCLVAVV